jgi:hypothetical protein
VEDYEGVVQDFDQVDILGPNDAFILKTQGYMKWMVEDYEGTLQDLDRANILQPNDAFNWKHEESWNKC